jgi:FixJ family two-component response regulator
MRERWRRGGLLSYSSSCALLKHWRGAGSCSDRFFASVRFFLAMFKRAQARIFGRIHNTRCMILDMRMPGMNGLELRRRAAASHREAPVIFITAHGDDGDTHR